MLLLRPPPALSCVPDRPLPLVPFEPWRLADPWDLPSLWPECRSLKGFSSATPLLAAAGGASKLPMFSYSGTLYTGALAGGKGTLGFKRLRDGQGSTVWRCVGWGMAACDARPSVGALVYRKGW